jgi:hypothetical protein
MRRTLLFLLLCLPATASAQSLTPTVVVRTGQSVPGVPGATFTNNIGTLPRLGANGHVAFNSFYTPGGGGGSIDFGYWVGTPDNLQLAVLEGAGDTFPGSTNVGVDEDGYISLWTQIGAEPMDQNQVLNTFIPSGRTTLVAKEGHTVAPGFGGGVSPPSALDTRQTTTARSHSPARCASAM